MKLIVSDGKQEETMETVSIPTAVAMTPASSSAAERKFLTKKRIISAVVVVLVTGLVVTGVLVGIWIFTQQTNLLLQYKLNLIANDNSKANQEVSTNQDENVVQYHVQNSAGEWWIVEDYNKNIKIAKVKDQLGVIKCLASSLDEALANQHVSAVTAPESQDQKAADSVSMSETMTIAEHPVKDSSFLSKTASNLCANTPVYWTYKYCANDTAAANTGARQKRSYVTACAPCYCSYTYCLTCNQYGSGSLSYYYYRNVYGYWVCSWSWWYTTAYCYIGTKTCYIG